MIYPKNFENKIGFDEIRALLKGRCLSTLGKEKVDSIAFSDQADVVNEWLQQVKEFRRLTDEHEEFPLQHFYDVRECVSRIRIENTHLDERELFDLRRSLETIHAIVGLLNSHENTPNRHESSERLGERGEGRNGGDDESEGSERNRQNGSESTRYFYPALHGLAEYVVTFPELVRRIDQILDKFGRVKDTASVTLGNIRRELAKIEGSISHTLYAILRSAQSEGLVEKDVTPTMRDGRLVIPVAPALKRRIKGIVHDESASGKTVFIEPTEVVEANNRVRELEAEERRELIRILTELANEMRPHVRDILESFQFLAQIDLIRAKAELAKHFNAFEPIVEPRPLIDWIRAIHPLLQMSLSRQQKSVVPLDIRLEDERIVTPSSGSPHSVLKGDANASSLGNAVENTVEADSVAKKPSRTAGTIGRLLIISGPNAGGKSVCLKTVGLLQYMLQCGLSIPVGERSKTGIFDNIMIDIGDEQSIENDLSTYSSHLMNMKNMMRHCNSHTLLLIDEFGGGTEPTIGGAIAESVLKQFCKRRTFGVITTHYQNLKHFADSHEGVVNGAMLYDRHEMQALFQLQIGQPGSSFAIEIARKTGIPEEVIRDASNIVGSDYIQSDKYLQDIVRDKRYWENKRESIHQREKDLERLIARYEDDMHALEQQRKDILANAKLQAEELLKQSNKKIENAIREIKESQAEKEETRRIREELKAFEQGVAQGEEQGVMSDEDFARKLKQMEERKARKEKRRREKALHNQEAAEKLKAAARSEQAEHSLMAGDTVRIKGLTSVGTIEQTDGKMATVIFGGMRTKMRLERLEAAEAPKRDEKPAGVVSRQTREAIDSRKLNFRQDLDVRGMRGDEAINAVMYFIDDAILVGMPRVRILHGKGNGILRQLIRQYLGTVPNVTHFQDEHVQFGGAGITVVDL